MDDQEVRLIEKVPVWCSARWVLAYVGIVGFACVYALRINMSIGIVCMVKDPDVIYSNVTTVAMVTVTEDPSDPCGRLDDTNPGYEGEFEWDKDLQGFVLSSFFYGYIVTQIPSGILAGIYGGKVVLGVGMLVASVATILLPVAARGHVGVVIFLRVLTGLGTGVAFPSMSALWGRWAPSAERSRLVTFTYAGTTIGNILALSLSGVICTSNIDGGWPLIFYAFGGASFLWCISWYFLAFSSPNEHPRIQDIERSYINSTVSHSTAHQDKMPPIPWRAIVTSGPLWGILIAHLCNNWGMYTILTNLPTFMKEVLKYDIKQNGFLSSLPYIVQFFALILGGQLADCLRAKYLSTTATRKIIQVSSFIGQATFMIATGYVKCEQRYLAVVFLTLATGFTTRAGYGTNHVDIAPRYAGVLYGITNTFGTIPGILAPNVVSALTPNETREEWQKVWYICAAFYGIGAILYALLASGEEQEWAKIGAHDEDDDDDDGDDELNDDAHLKSSVRG